MTPHYRLVFRGQLLPGMAREDAVRNLATLFKTPPERIEALLAASPAIIKASVDLDTALRYQQAMAEAGIVIQLEPLPADGSSTSGSAPEPKNSWDGVERRKSERRISKDRRSHERGSAIQPDRRQRDRRKSP